VRYITRLLFALSGAVLFVVSLGYAVWRYLTDFGGAQGATARSGAIATDLLLFTLFAAHHSLFARVGVKEWITRHVSPALERSVYVWIASAMFLGVCAWWQPVPGELWHASSPWSFILIALQLAGLVVTGLASRQIDVFDLAGLRQAAGLPAPDVPLVTTGLYRFVRHPIYFGWLLMVWPVPHMTATRLLFSVVSTLYLALAIPWEERGLVRQFGDDYTAYASRVRWRMAPYLY